MRTRPIGKTNLVVGCIGLGAMPLSLADRPDETVAIRVIHKALDSGMTLIDTADVYCLDERDIGHNERLIAKALYQWSGPPEQALVATKGGLERPKGDWVTNARPEHLKLACERSLKALGVEIIDLYQLHAPDNRVPFLESIDALKDLQSEGKIRYIGLSNVDVKQIEQALTRVDIISVQNHCNPYDSTSFSNGVVSFCSQHDIAFLPHSPVGGHFGHHRVAQDPILNRLGKKYHATAYQICLAWLLSTSPAMIPIPGASRIESVESSAAAVDLTLMEDDLIELNRAYGVRPYR